MQVKHWYRGILVIGLLALMTVMMIAPAAAQEPTDPDVAIQAVDFNNFLWNPVTTTVARGDGTVLTKLNIEGAQQISGFTLAIAYDASVVKPDTINPGKLLPGTRGVDYFMTVTTGGAGLACGGDSSFTVNVVYFDPTKTVNGTGSVVEILWRSDPDAAVGDSTGVCLDGATSLVVDNGGFPSLTPVPTIVGTITIDPSNLFKFQIGLEGGQNSGLVLPGLVPDPIFTNVSINTIYPCDGGGVDALGFCAFNNATATAPYTIKVSRAGYLDASLTLAQTTDSTSIWLKAGDLNDDNVVNIFDIQLAASLLGNPVGATTISNAADFTGPGYTPDGVINIMDLVLVAKNFGATGPTNGTIPGGSFPF